MVLDRPYLTSHRLLIWFYTIHRIAGLSLGLVKYPWNHFGVDRSRIAPNQCFFVNCCFYPGICRVHPSTRCEIRLGSPFLFMQHCIILPPTTWLQWWGQIKLYITWLPQGSDWLHACWASGFAWGQSRSLTSRICKHMFHEMYPAPTHTWT